MNMKFSPLVLIILGVIIIAGMVLGVVNSDNLIELVKSLLESS